MAAVLLVVVMVPVGVAGAAEVVDVGLISHASEPADGPSYAPAASTDGSVVVYESAASNLVVDDGNGYEDIFVRDAGAGTTSLISVGPGGVEANNDSHSPVVSGDGSFIVYYSDASNLVTGDTNGHRDVFLFDTSTGTTSRVSVASGGAQADGNSSLPAVSADGSTIVFQSDATNLVPGDTNGASDVFAYDVATGTTTRVSVGPGGVEANGGSSGPSVTADGSAIVYESSASNLVPGDTNSVSDVFAYDVATGTTTRVSVGPGGVEANGESYYPVISADGSTIILISNASNLTSGADGSIYEVFAFDVATGTTSLVSVSPGGDQANGDSYYPAVSDDGSIAVYESNASNLVSGDNNGYVDVFASNVTSGTTQLASAGLAGVAANGASNDAAVSGDGLTVVFASNASNLVSGDNNGYNDVFAARLSDPPVADDLTITVPEDTAAGSVIGTVTASDPDDDPLIYTITAGNGAGRFSIDDTGTITLVGVLDYETTAAYALTVTVSDGYLSDTATVTINVSDVTPFTDDIGSVFESDIEWLAFSGITKGCNPPANTMFCPGDFVTRGQMAAFLVRALGYSDDGGGNKFTDDDGSVFESAIDKLATAGVTKGCNPPANTMFCPGDFVTRGQMAAFLVRALGYSDVGGGNKFTDDDGSVFESAIDKLATAGVTKGCNSPDNTMFCPNDPVTRGQMAAFLHRALG